jgi:ribosome biogenesis GTPase A
MHYINDNNMQKDKHDFTVYVVGGMATGKSTLIDAMIGRKLM